MMDKKKDLSLSSVTPRGYLSRESVQTRYPKTDPLLVSFEDLYVSWIDGWNPYVFEHTLADFFSDTSVFDEYLYSHTFYDAVVFIQFSSSVRKELDALEEVFFSLYKSNRDSIPSSSSGLNSLERDIYQARRRLVDNLIFLLRRIDVLRVRNFYFLLDKKLNISLN